MSTPVLHCNVGNRYGFSVAKHINSISSRTQHKNAFEIVTVFSCNLLELELRSKRSHSKKRRKNNLKKLETPQQRGEESTTAELQATAGMRDGEALVFR